MIPVMVVLGPLTYVIMGRLEYGTPDGDPPFLILPVVSVIDFALITVTGLAFRGNAAVHKRLMLLGTVFLADAGYSRWLGGSIGRALGHGFGPFFAASYFSHVLMIGAMVGYDLATRRRVHPVVLAAMGLGLCADLFVTWVYNLPAWAPIAAHILGH
jgi:hypothetical protein